MPQLTKLKRAIYSQEYRSFVEKITGLEADSLTDEVRLNICMTLDMTNDCQTQSHMLPSHLSLYVGRLRCKLPY